MAKRPPPPANGRGRARGPGRGRQVDGAFLAVAAAFDVVVEALVLIERLHARRLDGGDVHEAVGRAVIGLNEAVALVHVEEFNGANLGHGCFLSRNGWCPAA